MKKILAFTVLFLPAICLAQYGGPFADEQEEFKFILMRFFHDDALGYHNLILIDKNSGKKRLDNSIVGLFDRGGFPGDIVPKYLKDPYAPMYLNWYTEAYFKIKLKEENFLFAPPGSGIEDYTYLSVAYFLAFHNDHSKFYELLMNGKASKETIEALFKK